MLCGTDILRMNRIKLSIALVLCLLEAMHFTLNHLCKKMKDTIFVVIKMDYAAPPWPQWYYLVSLIPKINHTKLPSHNVIVTITREDWEKGVARNFLLTKLLLVVPIHC